VGHAGDSALKKPNHRHQVGDTLGPKRTFQNGVHLKRPKTRNVNRPQSAAMHKDSPAKLPGPNLAHQLQSREPIQPKFDYQNVES